jgi:hypothetical protein
VVAAAAAAAAAASTFSRTDFLDPGGLSKMRPPPGRRDDSLTDHHIDGSLDPRIEIAI